MEEIRARRPTAHRQTSYTLLPLRASRLSNTISCWYCDLKISAFNEPVFCFGRRHARLLRSWFSMGIGFSLTTLVLVTLILVWEFGRALFLLSWNTEFSNLFSMLLFGFPSEAPALAVSLSDSKYLFISSLISVSVHEFGHALAAASEGIHMEYIAIFIAVLFPGALVAFNQELLQVLPRAAAFRIYSAGIWHNAVCCAACGLALFVLPFVLYPLYIHSENPMVLDVSSTSPLSGYLSTGDRIVSLDGMPIHDVQDWVQLTSYIHQQTLNNFNRSKDSISNTGRKGYCVPQFMIKESRKTDLVNNLSICPKDLTAFSTLSCSQSDYSVLDDAKHDNGDRGESGHCLAANAIIKLSKCGDGWLNTNSSRCTCSEHEHCVAPVLPGLDWVEIAYSSLYSSKCLHLHSDPFPGPETIDYGKKCSGTFVFIGDLSFMVQSVQMSSYQPRWRFSFGVYFPHILEKLLMSTYHVSLTLALLNSLPVYFLDGEAVLEVLLGYFNALSYHSREKVLQACLFGGTLLSILAFLRVLIVSLF